ncbi:MAG TPA: hypothetical protein VLU47_14885, partial [Blastocatellia bacterium]|nr:hypothetical protein [Blastocatellia bacterium]
VESHRKPERSRVFVFSWPIKDGSFQILLTTIAAVAVIAGIVQSILDQMRICIGPRAPPAVS